MMEFISYLSTDGKDIYKLLSKKIHFAENTSICRKHKIYGWFESSSKTMVFCTQRIKSNPDFKYYVEETLLHESGHVAQYCKGRGTVVPLGLNANYLSSRRIEDLKLSVSMFGNQIRKVETEAYWLENKPSEVKTQILKYCF